MKPTEQLARTHLAPEPRDLARLVAGKHHNPHGILGAHEYGDHTVIRAFRPHATEVVALVGEEIAHQMRPRGLHEVGLDTQRRGQRLRQIDVDPLELAVRAQEGIGFVVASRANTQRAALDDRVEPRGDGVCRGRRRLRLGKAANSAQQ